jgi:hypothetical protein
MAAFLPYVAATLILDALHVHPFAPEHGALCRHHVTEPPTPLRATTNYDCPACNWQRNLPKQVIRTWSPDVVRTALQVVAPAATLDATTDLIQPARFRGPPASAV